MENTANNLAQAIEVLKNGGVVAFPTETSYGLGCDATNEEAVARVAAMKSRPKKFKMALVVKDLEMARWCGELNDMILPFAKKHWPGPLTILLPNANKELTDWSVLNGTVGVRISSHPIAMELAEALGKPLIATSANKHGEPSCYSVEAIKEQLEGQSDQPDIYVDGGVLPEVPPSMIIELVDGEVVVHRPGSFKLRA